MYTTTTEILSGRTSGHPFPSDDDLHFGLRLYKDGEVYDAGVDATRHRWNILVFESGAYTPDMGYKDAGMYVAPVLDLQSGAVSGERFEGYLLSIPIPFWRVLDVYDLERRFTSFHFRPFVELDRKEAHDLCLLMSLMESPLAEGINPYDDMELLHLCRAFVATLNRYYETQDARTTGNRYADEFLKLVEEHCPEEKKLDFYSGLLGISTRYLSTVVSKTTGKAASRWIMDRVIEVANNQLFSTSLPICEIAGNMGFASSSDFCKYYRTYTGLTPMQYRKACLKQGTLIKIG